jgi:hypothetical protein
MSLKVELLKRVKQHILEEPARLRMDLWLLKADPSKDMHTSTPGYNEPEDYKIPECGIVGCIAGWTAFLVDPNVNPDSYQVRAEHAQELLGINHRDEPFDLFYVDHWPADLMDRYYSARDNDERAQITATAIDRYIENYKEY